MAKAKKTKEPELLPVTTIPGADPVSEEDSKGFTVDMNFSDVPVSEEATEEATEEAPEEATEEVTEEATEEVAEQAEPTEEETVFPAEETTEEVEEIEEAAEVQSQVTDDFGNEVEVEQEKAPMVPKSRLDEVLQKQKALQKQLDDLKAEKLPKVEEPTEYDFAAKETEYQDLLLNGEAEKASALRNEIREAEKAQYMYEVEQRVGQKVQQNTEYTELQQKALELQKQYPILDENTADFNKDIVDEVITLRDAFMTKGQTGPDALQKAAEYVLKVKTPELVTTKPTPEAKKDIERKKKANVSKKMEASKAQPPQMAGESQNVKDSKVVDINRLSEKEFNALPEETLKRLRGDFG